MPDRENVIKTLEKIKAQTKEIGLDKAVLAHKFMDEIIELLKEQEAKEQISDAIHETAKQFRQTIVRCKDCGFGEACKNGRDEPGVMCYNSHSASHGWVHEPDWFCADGERVET